MKTLAVALLLPIAAFAQLIPNGSPVPRRSSPPVVFMNGYQNDCGGSNFAGTFGNADQILQSNGRVSLYFNNCNAPQRTSIESLGKGFGDFLTGLKYDDGQAVDQVDVVAHSMGGLILRSYLSGKQPDVGVFQPPAVTHVRKAVFLATPHFGSGIAVGLGLDHLTEELSSGSPFLFDLGSWNQGRDDLRGVDAMAIAGNAGTGFTVAPGLDDGVVALTSASIAFARPGRTRVLPLCHTPVDGLVAFFHLCGDTAKGIAQLTTESDANTRIVLSFLNGTTEWMTIGTAAEDNAFLSQNGGLAVVRHDANDAPLPMSSATAVSDSGTTKNLNLPNTAVVAYTDLFPAGPLTLKATASGTEVQRTGSLAPAVYLTAVVKPGPLIAGVFPSAAANFPLVVAPGMFVSIYGQTLAVVTAQAPAVPYPDQLGGAVVKVDNTPIPLQYVSASQINGVFPAASNGLVKLTVQNESGSRTVNVLVDTAAPAIFTAGSEPNGIASALIARNGSIITAANPINAGEYVELFLTGLGATTTRDGLDWANQVPTVQVGGKDCAVSYAGRAPRFPGLDQINCVVPTGVTGTVALTVTSGSRASNTVKLPVQ